MSKRDIIKKIMSDKAMTLYDILKHCDGLISDKDARNTVNNMNTARVLTVVGTRPKEHAGGGNKFVYVYKLRDDLDVPKTERKGLCNPKLSINRRKELIVKNNPMMYLYAKELNL